VVVHAPSSATPATSVRQQLLAVGGWLFAIAADQADPLRSELTAIGRGLIALAIGMPD
jgi:hypothetical protein